jgi:uncharacterized protein (DUF488 family)
VALPFFTIGHSNRSLDEFFELLRGADIGLVADIRRAPMSRANPQFNKDTLADALAAFDISYEHMAALGGLRGKSRSVPRDVNGFWTNESFHNFADYALSTQFHEGLEHLLAEGRQSRCATCVRRSCGGVATGASSPTILSPAARPCSTSWGMAGWSQPV